MSHPAHNSSSWHLLPPDLQVCGYDGPVFMTHPTRAIAPIMLHDFYK